MSKWENDREEPKLSSLNQVAQFFNVDIDYFFNESQPSNASSLPRNTARIPVIGTIACGDPIDADENIVDYINVPEPIPTGAFALVCEGSSMEPSIVDGDKVVIEPTPDVEDGQVAAVLVDDQTKATLKRIKHIGNSIWLMPDNRDYDPIVLDAQHPGRIIGKAIKLIRDRI
ncbi:XRE family transcriptional regulator [Lactobacillus delbrueckii subsp. bulgaricus]|nr:XRE family transcriptional regulator [Lactobacillus delbrueckii subsp. bulgaricus]NWO31694.1 XRE family transcriptional regulator [Lactobacillus delbrueckii subsp. bulgaricus]